MKEIFVILMMLSILLIIGCTEVDHVPDEKTCSFDGEYSEFWNSLSEDAYAQGQIYILFNQSIEEEITKEDAIQYFAESGLTINKFAHLFEENSSNGWHPSFRWVVLDVPEGEEMCWVMYFRSEPMIGTADLEFYGSLD